MTLLPAILSLLPRKNSRAFSVRPDKAAKSDITESFMTALGTVILSEPKAVLIIIAVFSAVAMYGASLVVVNEDRIENFKTSEALYKADKKINRLSDGIYHLDVMIETPEYEDLYKVENLLKIEALQRHLETLPGVKGTTSVVDYIKQMHKAVNENQGAYYSLPEDPFLIAQLFFLYGASADPIDFEEEIDGERRLALVRANVSVGSYINNKPLVEQAQAYIREHFTDNTIKANLTGRLYVDYHWIEGIASSHLASVIVAFMAVGLMATLLFRSVILGALSALPVGVAIFTIYGVMGFGGIWLGVGTSMFASIAIGLGVDFTIHTIEKMRELMARGESLITLYKTTGRALFFNFAAVTLGFGVLLTSDVPALMWFGGLVAVAVSTAFFTSMTLLPAVGILLGEKYFLRKKIGNLKSQAALFFVFVVAGGLFLSGNWSESAQADDTVSSDLDAYQIMEK